MVGKNSLKLIKSLHQKKYRNQHRLFFVEGAKMVNELLYAGYDVHRILVTPKNTVLFADVEHDVLEPDTFRKISALQNPNGVMGVFQIPEPKTLDFADWVLALDAVRDPGNLGTIIRLCDWFGISHLVCSASTVDCYNPKVVQATMGSVVRVNVSYTDLPKFLEAYRGPVYGAFMEGEVMYDEVLPKKGVLVMGNEGHGISENVKAFINHKISIPQYGSATAESLNVASATAVVLGELRRQLTQT